jgi:hypothetical protein
MQQHDDPNFATSLQRFHTKIPSSHDVDAINSIHMDFNIVATTFEFKTIILTSNLLRIAFKLFMCKTICHTRGISTNTIPCSCHEGPPFDSFYSWVLKPQLFIQWQKQFVCQWFWNLRWECLSCAHTKILDPRKLLTEPWVMLLVTSCQKLQLHITKSLMKLMGIQYLFHPHYLT